RRRPSLRPRRPDRHLPGPGPAAIRPRLGRPGHPERRLRHHPARPPAHHRRACRRGSPDSVTTTHELFNVRTPSDALARLLSALPVRVECEMVRTADALDRILAEDVAAPSDLPTFRRSTMDGFAVRA